MEKRTYSEFIKSKEIEAINAGIEFDESELNKNLMPFQRDIVAWALVRKAVNVPWDQFEASFATLPRAAQIAVGSPESLKELAQMDTQRFETVAQSNFLRMYDAAQIRDNKEQRVPNAALAVRERLQKELEARRSKDLLEASDTKKLDVGKMDSWQSIKAGGGVEAPTELMKSLRERLGV